MLIVIRNKHITNTELYPLISCQLVLDPSGRTERTLGIVALKTCFRIKCAFCPSLIKLCFFCKMHFYVWLIARSWFAFWRTPLWFRAYSASHCVDLILSPEHACKFSHEVAYGTRYVKLHCPVQCANHILKSFNFCKPFACNLSKVRGFEIVRHQIDNTPRSLSVHWRKQLRMEWEK